MYEANRATVKKDSYYILISTPQEHDNTLLKDAWWLCSKITEEILQTVTCLLGQQTTITGMLVYLQHVKIGYIAVLGSVIIDHF